MAQTAHNNKPLIPSVLAEHPEYLVIDKPAGLLVHSTAKQEPDTLVAWMLARYPDIAHVGEDLGTRPGIVHRLDKETSGIMVIARTQRMYEHLKQQFLAHTVIKEYTAIVHGAPRDEQGIVALPLARSSRGTFAGVSEPDENGRKSRSAVTEWRVVRRFADAALLDVRIRTGRTHQIRAHCFAIGHPVVGDPLYRAKLRWRKRLLPPPRMMLHAHRLSFTDLNGLQQTFISDLPDEITAYCSSLNVERKK